MLQIIGVEQVQNKYVNWWNEILIKIILNINQLLLFFTSA